MQDFMYITKALADESRVRTIMALKNDELCVCQIIELLELAPSTVSKHMAILRQARLVEGRKSGRWIRYRRADAAVNPYLASTLAWLDQCLQDNPLVCRDREKLEAILKIPPEEICKHQVRGAEKIRMVMLCESDGHGSMNAPTLGRSALSWKRRFPGRTSAVPLKG